MKRKRGIKKMIAVDKDRDYFGFKENTGGLFNFQGVIDNDKKIKEIYVDRDNSTAYIKYEDGYKFTVSCKIEKNGNKFTITEINKEWSKENE